MSKYEQYQNAIDQLTLYQLLNGKGWNRGFQMVIDTLKNAQLNMTVEEGSELCE